MRKWVLLFVGVGGIVGLWAYARTLRYPLPWNQPKWGAVDRGDIRVPITAAGLIEPNERIEIKSKASGEVIRVPVREGDRVTAGDVLLELDPDDEQRNVDRAQAAADRVEALLAQARVQLEQSRVNVEIARARVDELEAQGEALRVDLENELDLRERGATSKLSIINAQSRFDVNRAQLAAARLNIRSAENDVLTAEAQVRNQEANLREATKALEDARERLSETIIRSPVDAIVTDVKTSVGALVQSGVGNLMGGTTLMTLADLSRLKVVARVDEADYGAVTDIAPIEALPQIEGMRAAARADADKLARRTGKVLVTVDAFRDQEFEGVISRVEPQGRQNVGATIIQFNVHIDVTDPKRDLLPLGTQAQVEFTVQSAEGVLRVPADAVKVWQQDKGVWLKLAPASGARELYGKRFVPCRFGVTDGEFIEVVAVLGSHALKEGDEVYTKLPVESDDEGR